jgi:hypothetical protein
MAAVRQRPTPSSPEDSAGRTIRRLAIRGSEKPTPSLPRVSTCQSETSGNLVKLDQLVSGIVRADEYAVTFRDRLPGNSGVSQIRNVQRSSRSGLTCQCVASEIDSTEVRIPSPVWPNDLGRMNRTSAGGTNFTHGATGVVWLTGVSISLNAVSGRSAMGMTETKATAVARRSRTAHLLRLNTRAPQVEETISRWLLVVKVFFDY